MNQKLIKNGNLSLKKQQELTALGFVLQKFIEESKESQIEQIKSEISIMQTSYTPLEWSFVEKAMEIYEKIKTESKNKIQKYLGD